MPALDPRTGWSKVRALQAAEVALPSLAPFALRLHNTGTYPPASMRLIQPSVIIWPMAVLASMLASASATAGELRPSQDANANRDAQMTKHVKDLDAVALQILLQPMFRSSHKGPLGMGAAGQHWQSMLVEQISKQIARQGGLRLIPADRGRAGTRGRPMPTGLRLAPLPAGRSVSSVAKTGPAVGRWQTTVAYPELTTIHSLNDQSIFEQKP